MLLIHKMLQSDLGVKSLASFGNTPFCPPSRSESNSGPPPEAGRDGSDKPLAYTLWAQNLDGAGNLPGTVVLFSLRLSLWLEWHSF
jgi:hypothetical protein